MFLKWLQRNYCCALTVVIVGKLAGSKFNRRHLQYTHNIHAGNSISTISLLLYSNGCKYGWNTHKAPLCTRNNCNCKWIHLISLISAGCTFSFTTFSVGIWSENMSLWWDFLGLVVGCRSNAVCVCVCLSLTVSLSQEGGSLVDSSGALRFPLYTAWLELNQKEVTSDL